MKDGGHKLHTCNNPCCNVCEGGLSSCDVCGGAEIDLPRVCPGRRMTEGEREAVRAGGPGPAPETQRDRARAALARLYRNAVDLDAFRSLAGVLDAAQSGLRNSGDGSIDNTLWTFLRKMADAFAEVQRLHEIMARGQPTRAERLGVALNNAVSAGICAAEERDSDKYQTAKRALLAWCTENRVPEALRDEAMRQFKDRVAAVAGPKSPAGPVAP